jgi:tetratricopeptide (TPR) repeat protein
VNEAPSDAPAPAKVDRKQHRKRREGAGRGAHRAEHKEHKEPKKVARRIASKPSKGFDIAARRAAAHDACQRGNGLLLAGDVDGAVAAYQEAVRAWPNDSVPYRGLGLAQEKKGNIPAAIAAFRRYLNLGRKSPDHELIARRLQRLQAPPQ